MMNFLLLSIIVVIISKVAIFKTKNKKSTSNNEDNENGLAFNILFSLIYIPLSLFCVLIAGFIWDSPLKNELDKITRTIVSYVLMLMPLISIISITISIILRKRGKKTLSFNIQILPIVILILTFLLL